MLLLLTLPSDHSDLLPLLPVLPGVASLLVVKLGVAVLGDGSVDLGQSLVAALLGSSLVPTEVSPTRTSVGELLAVVHVVLVTSRDDNGLAAFLLRAVDPSHGRSVYPGLRALHPEEPLGADLDAGNGSELRNSG